MNKKIKLFQSKYRIYPRYSRSDFNIYQKRLLGNKYLLLKQVLENTHVVIDVDKLLVEIQRSNLENDFFIIKYDAKRQTFINNKDILDIEKCYANDIDEETMFAILKLTQVNSQEELSELINNVGGI